MQMKLRKFSNEHVVPFALERADCELGGTGLLTCDHGYGCAFPPFWGSGFMQPKYGRLQLRGSGGFTPLFPSIAPAIICLIRETHRSETTALTTPPSSNQKTLMHQRKIAAKGDSRIVNDLP